MSTASKILKIIKKPSLLFPSLGHRGFFNWMSDEKYLKKLFKIRTGNKLDLDAPKTFNEKLQWLKLHNRNPEYTKLVDKYEVKKIVAEKIGEQHIIPTLGVWDRFDDIDFDKLPDRFVLKCTHDSGGLVICRDKSRLDINAARKKINQCLKHNYYWGNREWPYKDVKPRIIAEQYMEDHTLNDLRDYKIHCFGGVPKYLQVIGNRNHSAHTGNQMFYTFDWKHAGWQFGDYPPYPQELEKPVKLEKMYEIASELSKDLTYVRVDLYEINGQIYFGELTIYPGSGFYQYVGGYNSQTDLMLGKMVKLPE